MEFAHICPAPLLRELVLNRPFHLLLSHLINNPHEICSPQYTKFFYNLSHPEKTYKDNYPLYILDNGAYEFTMSGQKIPSPLEQIDKLIEKAMQVRAQYLVLPDYPGESSAKTINVAINFASQVRAAGIGTFFCPQSKVNDLQDLVECFQWAAVSPLVDYIGFSILAIPNAFGVLQNKQQRFLARWKFCEILNAHGIFETIVRSGKKIHFLGMLDGPNEIQLMGKYVPFIATWDSSAAIWSGLHRIEFDGSPTGLYNGKFVNPVDFNYYTEDDEDIMAARRNMDYIDRLTINYDQRFSSKETWLNEI